MIYLQASGICFAAPGTSASQCCEQLQTPCHELLSGLLSGRLSGLRRIWLALSFLLCSPGWFTGVSAATCGWITYFLQNEGDSLSANAAQSLSYRLLGPALPTQVEYFLSPLDVRKGPGVSHAHNVMQWTCFVKSLVVLVELLYLSGTPAQPGFVSECSPHGSFRARRAPPPRSPPALASPERPRSTPGSTRLPDGRQCSTVQF